MNLSVADILAAAMSLPEEDREALAVQLLRSLRPPGVLSEDDPNFFAELDHRVDALERGETKARDWEEVSRELRQQLRQRRRS